MYSRAIAVVLALSCLGGPAACSRTTSAGAGGTATPEPVTTLKVINQSFLDMNVYVIRAPAGPRQRLGTAIAASTTKMTIPGNIILGGSTSLKFLTDPIGRTRPSVSQSIIVTRGDIVTLRIPPG